MNKNICKRCGLYLSLNMEVDQKHLTCSDESKFYMFKIRCFEREDPFPECIHSVYIPRRFNKNLLNQLHHGGNVSVDNLRCFPKIEPDKSCPYYVEHILKGSK